MVTIYFDKQLFSHLFKSQEEKYLVLREKILSHRDEFIFTYSNAHLFDLQQDTTDISMMRWISCNLLWMVIIFFMNILILV